MLKTYKAAFAALMLTGALCPVTYAKPVLKCNRDAKLSGLNYNNAVPITGKITDANGQPLVGASVKEKGSAGVTLTDGDGNFKRSDVTGAVSSVTSKTLTETPVANAAQALQGRVAGMYITNNSGRLGDASLIRIRGNRSITAGNNPLYVIDGIPMTGSINTVNPADIELIDVLKDASSTAIYGSRGANGVILITTKRGTGNKPVISYNPHYGITKRTGQIKMLNGAGYAAFKQSAGATLLDYQQNALANSFETNWQDTIFRKGYRQDHALSLRGASNKTKYLISLDYFNEKGIVQKSDYARYSVRVNLDQEVSKKIKAGTAMFVAYDNQNYGIIPNNVYLQNVLLLDPLSSPWNADGSVNLFPDGQNIKRNPYGDINSVTANNRKSYRVFVSAYGEYNIVDNLTYRLNVGVDNTNNNNGTYNSTISNQGGLATAGVSNNYSLSYTIENLLNYKKQFGKQSVAGTALFSFQRDQSQMGSTFVSGVPYDSQLFYNLGTATQITAIASNYSESALTSFMGRVNYWYDDRYLVTLS